MATKVVIKCTVERDDSLNEKIECTASRNGGPDVKLSDDVVDSLFRTNRISVSSKSDDKSTFGIYLCSIQ